MRVVKVDMFPLTIGKKVVDMFPHTPGAKNQLQTSMLSTQAMWRQ